jgi:hypothetical protein
MLAVKLEASLRSVNNSLTLIFESLNLKKLIIFKAIFVIIMLFKNKKIKDKADKVLFCDNWLTVGYYQAHYL